MSISKVLKGMDASYSELLVHLNLYYSKNNNINVELAAPSQC